MSRWIVAMIGVVMLAGPAFATVVPTNGTNPQNITITLVIPCFTQVYWNNTADQNIVFNDTVQNGGNGGDWYSTVLTGQYGVAPKASQDPFAAGYYESNDTAYFWLDSNCNTTMTLTSAGDLANGTHTLPTWYTACVTNNTGNAPFGFINNSARVATCGNAPGDGPANYMEEEPAGAMMIDTDCDAFWPNQSSFHMATPSTYTYGFLGHAQGTVLFHARVLRNALSDAGGTYTTTLAVLFN
jgi:hypothetical protein